MVLMTNTTTCNAYNDGADDHTYHNGADDEHDGHDGESDEKDNTDDDDVAARSACFVESVARIVPCTLFPTPSGRRSVHPTGICFARGVREVRVPSSSTSPHHVQSRRQQYSSSSSTQRVVVKSSVSLKVTHPRKSLSFF